MATAHAKARWSQEVTAKDAEAAIELVQFAIFKKVIQKARKKRERQDGEESETEESEDEEVIPSKRRQFVDDPYEFSESEPRPRKQRDDPQPGPSGYSSKRAPSEQDEGATGEPVDEEKFRNLQKTLMSEFRTQHVQLLGVGDFKAIMAKSSMQYTDAEIDLCLSRMQDENKIMLSDNVIFLV